MSSLDLWDDVGQTSLMRAYVVEYVPEPGSLALLARVALFGARTSRALLGRLPDAD